MKEKTYSIGDIAKLTGVNQRKLRAWEESGVIPEADRLVCGNLSYRRFTDTHLQLLLKIVEHQAEGFTLRVAAEK